MHEDQSSGTSEHERTPDQLGAIISAAGRRPEPPPAAYQSVLAAAHESWRGAVRAKRRRRSLALAAVVAGIAVGTVIFIATGGGGSAPVIATAGVIQGDVRVQGRDDDRWQMLNRAAGPIVAGSRLRTTPNGRVALNLAGDASLRMDAGSEIRLVSARTIELRSGTLYIDSGAATDGNAFRVATPLATVIDVGTQFEVMASDEAVRVRIRDGSVSIDAPGNTTITGAAGEQLSLGTDGIVGREVILPFDPAWAWVETLADPPEIEGQSLILFLDWVTRETGHVVRFDAPATESRARTVVLHGSADNLEPMRALEVMLSTTDFDYTLRDGAILISPRSRSR
jgi:ferric-dicitrate binding protein FerR (iron transport regulator)